MRKSNYRLEPDHALRDFLILTDLLTWLTTAVQDAEGPVLDFGCGDSPYRALLRAPIYHRADRPGEKELDFEIQPDETIVAGDAAYRTILSTQVLEHVYLHMEYLRESYRLLAPGGRLLITTHGLFEEHGHPNDFRRWTLTGLSKDLESTGLVIERADKLTVGPRALLYLLGSQVWKVNPSRKNPLGLLLSLLRAFIAKYPQRWNRFVDRHFSAYRLQPGLSAEESLFIGVAILARKPA